MGDIAFGVDEVAAHNLLIALGLEASEDRIAEVAAHMRAHRASAEQYRLDKARDDCSPIWKMRSCVSAPMTIIGTPAMPRRRARR